MYKQEKIKPYEGQGDKGKLVEEMFDNIAPTYDTLNHRLSWDIGNTCFGSFAPHLFLNSHNTINTYI